MKITTLDELTVYKSPAAAETSVHFEASLRNPIPQLYYTTSYMRHVTLQTIKLWATVHNKYTINLLCSTFRLGCLGFNGDVIKIRPKEQQN